MSGLWLENNLSKMARDAFQRPRPPVCTGQQQQLLLPLQQLHPQLLPLQLQQFPLQPQLQPLLHPLLLPQPQPSTMIISKMIQIKLLSLFHIACHLTY